MDARRIRSALGWRARRYLNRTRARVPHRPYPAILMYHRIAQDSFDPWGEAVAPDRFREQLEWLAANRTLLCLADFAERHRRETLPCEAIAITFDDGYACIADTAAPLLEEVGVPATVFVSPEIIRIGSFWWQELQSIVLEHDGTTLEFDGHVIELGERTPRDHAWAPGSPPSTPRQRAYAKVQILLSRMPPDRLKQSLGALRNLAAPAVDAAKRPMSAEKVRRIASDRIEFGSHALTHAWLPNLSDDQQTREIEGSVEQCRELTGHKPTAFAYPYGMFDERAKANVAAAGFDCACTTQDLAVSSRSPTHALPRLAVGNWAAPALKRALNRLCLA
jgi:peptidoglycan/xylan/chitin deacetylase (PgdA/CDA1 family)